MTKPEKITEENWPGTEHVKHAWGPPAEKKTGGARMYGRYEAHPAAELYPLMTEEELIDLAADIEAKGVLEPVTLYQGRLLDGRNRCLAWERLGNPPLKGKPVNLGDLTPTEWVISKNSKRRHLTKGQLASIGAKATPMITEDIKRREAERKHMVRKKVETTQSDESATETTGRNSAQSKTRAPKAVETAGKALGVSGDSVRIAKKIQKEDPDLAKKLEAGEISLNAAEKQLKKSKSAEEDTPEMKAMLAQPAPVDDDREASPYLSGGILQSLRSAHHALVKARRDSRHLREGDGDVVLSIEDAIREIHEVADSVVAAAHGVMTSEADLDAEYLTLLEEEDK